MSTPHPSHNREISQVLAHYGLADGIGANAPPTVYRGFSGAEVYRVETVKGPVAVRRWPKDSLPRERIRELHRFLSHLRQTGLKTVAVPFACRTNPTETLVDHKGNLWHCESWFPGNSDLASRLTPFRITASLQALADWHLAASTFQPLIPASTWFSQSPQAAVPAIQERRVILQRWTPERVVRILDRLQFVQPNQQDEVWSKWVSEYLHEYLPLAPRIEEELNQAALWQVRLQPCLRDVWHDHILLDGDQVTGIIDPTAARTENVAIDLARLLGSLFPPECEYWNLALEAYQQKNSLSQTELRLVSVFYRSSTLLSGLSWIEKLIGGQQKLFKNPQVRDRLVQLLERLRQLPNYLK
ncbi:homoserine kinase [Polystyrenella longa]|uniref:Homoserine kinase n=1 Tax=Polystyrenella longa TaxID=2528007 RepID=A0A518CMZ1_9PLAN|nr:aminoglycoside phosphotransferase family protein [Polystyrenella longa]QDU80592.1 homoserine kinase [Polystyrenella longa]